LFNPKTAIGFCIRRGSASGSAGILPAKRMHQIMRTIFAGKMPALPRKASPFSIPVSVFNHGLEARATTKLGIRVKNLP